MRVESSLTSITWILSEAVSGLPNLTFTVRLPDSDQPPPERLQDHDGSLRAEHRHREAA